MLYGSITSVRLGLVALRLRRQVPMIKGFARSSMAPARRVDPLRRQGTIQSLRSARRPESAWHGELPRGIRGQGGRLRARFRLQADQGATRESSPGQRSERPGNTGIEVAIDDTTGSGMHDPGAFTTWFLPDRTPRNRLANGIT